MKIFKKNYRIIKSQFIHITVFFSALALLFSCSGTSTSVKDASFNSEVSADINFFDSSSFDSKLSSSLRSKQPDVTAHFLSPVDINNIPKRMDKWFSMVEEYGGTIELEPEGPQPKGLISELISLAIGTYDMLKEKVTYKPVKQYNAKIIYDASTGIINRIVFEQKPDDENH
ncbi:hypothetical protein QUF70_10770 [Desulfobacterales bacterium HSG17]|nr:hypothetical protein [Desulfobacterales bacterium HSG17]